MEDEVPFKQDHVLCPDCDHTSTKALSGTSDPVDASVA